MRINQSSGPGASFCLYHRTSVPELFAGGDIPDTYRCPEEEGEEEEEK